MSNEIDKEKLQKEIEASEAKEPKNSKGGLRFTDPHSIALIQKQVKFIFSFKYNFHQKNTNVYS